MAKRTRRKNSNNNLNHLTKRVQSNLPNFLLGLTILVVAALLASLFFQKNNQGASGIKQLSNIFTGGDEEEEKQKPSEKLYVVKEGDHLWKIAEDTYGSGYNAYDIAKVNKLMNPNLISAGQKLILPVIAPKEPTTGMTSAVATDKRLTQDTAYVVQEGDHLWKIAENAYGDGFAWVRIAQANKDKIFNPNLIYPNTKLVLPQ